MYIRFWIILKNKRLFRFSFVTYLFCLDDYSDEEKEEIVYLLNS